MTRPTYAIPALVLVLSLFTFEAFAAEISGYRGLLLGMSIEQAERKLAGSDGLMRCKTKPRRASGCLQFIERGKPDRNVTAFFKDNKAYLIRLLPQVDKTKLDQKRCTDLYDMTREAMKNRYGKPDSTEKFKKFGSLIRRSVWLDKGRHLRVSGSWMESAEFRTGVMVDFRNKPYR